MLLNVDNRNSKPARKLPLRLVLIVPFILLIFSTLGLMGLLFLRNGQKAIDANTQIILLIFLGALEVATLLEIFTARWITQVILQLSEASQAIASGDLDKIVQEAKGVKELEVLSQSLNQIAGQLRESSTTLEKTKEELEKRVEERTAEIKLAKEEAEAAIALKANLSLI